MILFLCIVAILLVLGGVSLVLYSIEEVDHRRALRLNQYGLISVGSGFLLAVYESFRP